MEFSNVSMGLKLNIPVISFLELLLVCYSYYLVPLVGIVLFVLIITQMNKEITGQSSSYSNSLIVKGTLISCTGYLLWKLVRWRIEAGQIQTLRRCIFDNKKGAAYPVEHLKPTRTKLMEDMNICLQVQCIPILAAKSKLPNAQIASDNSISSDPFLPPFAEGKIICELPAHWLMPNKYYLIKHHLLIATKQFEDQLDPLTCGDWEQSILLVKAMEGLMFFNGGQKAGFSQRHKHMQIFPKEVFGFPLISMISGDARRGCLIKDKISNFYLFQGLQSVVHGIAVLQGNPKGSEYFKAYTRLLKELTAIIGVEKVDYNLLTWQKHILIVPRAKQRFFYDSVGANSALFLGIVMTKSEQVFEQIDQKYPSPSSIVQELCYEWPISTMKQ